jgi:hypothetical protein
MTLELFAGIRVSEYAAARPWYERLLGGEPTFLSDETEAVWELDEHRHLFIEEDVEDPGGEIAKIRREPGGVVHVYRAPQRAKAECIGDVYLTSSTSLDGHGPRLAATSRAGVGDPT